MYVSLLRSLSFSSKPFTFCLRGGGCQKTMPSPLFFSLGPQSRCPPPWRSFFVPRFHGPNTCWIAFYSPFPESADTLPLSCPFRISKAAGANSFYLVGVALGFRCSASLHPPAVRSLSLSSELLRRQSCAPATCAPLLATGGLSRPPPFFGVVLLCF